MMHIVILILRIFQVLGTILMISCLGMMIYDPAFAKTNKNEISLFLLFSFGVLMVSLGMIGFLTGVIPSTNVGDIQNARRRYPVSWFLSNGISLTVGISFLVWGVRVFIKWTIG